MIHSRNKSINFEVLLSVQPNSGFMLSCCVITMRQNNAVSKLALTKLHSLIFMKFQLCRQCVAGLTECDIVDDLERPLKVM